MILRKWTGTIRARDKDAYLAYIRRTGMREYRKTPGNRGAQMVTRDLPRGRVEVTTLSWWDDLESIRGFAGEDIERAHYYPMDRKYLLTRPTKVQHFEIDEDAAPPTKSDRAEGRPSRPKMRHIVIDSLPADFDRTIAFWTKLLGAAVEPRRPGARYAKLKGSLGPVILLFQRVEQEPGIHLDVTTFDTKRDVRRAAELGGAKPRKVKRWQIVRDPTGNAVCLLPPGL
jgi:hypothetical protein